MYCPLPFNHLNIEPNGDVTPCCNTPETKVIGNCNNSTVEEIFNGIELKSFRKSFLTESSSLPPECYQCQKVEEAGGVSLRQASAKMYPRDQINTGTPNVIRYLGLRFDNLCNLKCRICMPTFSTSWVSDYKALGREVPNGPLKSFKSKEDLITQLDKALGTVTQLYIAGGEPFMSPLLYELLDEIKRRGRSSEIEITFNTNGTISEFKGKSLEEYLHGFKSVSLGVSIDGVYEQAEYLRSGASWDLIDKNIKTYMGWDNVNVYISPTIGNLNFYYLPELLNYCLKDLGLSPGSIGFGQIFEPKFFRPSQFPESFKPILHKRVLSNALELLDSPAYDKGEALSLFKQIRGMIQLSKIPFDSQIHDQFIEEISEIDKIRGEAFERLFPEVSEVFMVRQL